LQETENNTPDAKQNIPMGKALIIPEKKLSGKDDTRKESCIFGPKAGTQKSI